MEAGGILTTAARKLGCASCTIYEYLDRFRALKGVLAEARESALDEAESELMKLIRAGNLTAIIFFLKTQGKSRGYSERGEFGHTAGNEPVKVTFKINSEPHDSM